MFILYIYFILFLINFMFIFTLFLQTYINKPIFILLNAISGLSHKQFSLPAFFSNCMGHNLLSLYIPHNYFVEVAHCR